MAAQGAAAAIIAEFQAIKFWRGLFEGSWNVAASAMKRRSTFRPPRVYSLNILFIALGGSISLFEEDVSASTVLLHAVRPHFEMRVVVPLSNPFDGIICRICYAEAFHQPKFLSQVKFDRTKVFENPTLSAISRIRSESNPSPSYCFCCGTCPLTSRKKVGQGNVQSMPPRSNTTSHNSFQQ